MAVYVPFKQPRTGEVRTVKVGWSWVLFFWAGFLGIPLFLRRLNIWGFVFLALWLVNILAPIIASTESVGVGGVTTLVAIGLQIWLGIRGNEMTAKNYLEQGWEFAEPAAEATRIGRETWGITA
ncbi:MAG TPA: hypothetical protein VF678_01795 [bacterium]